jgi:hypothetical protein
VEEPALLLAMQWIVRRVQVEHDLPRRPPMGLHEQVDQQGFDRRPVMADPVVPRRLRTAQLQSVQRDFAVDRRAIRTLCLELARQHRQQRIVPKMVVTVDAFVASARPNTRWPTSVRTSCSISSGAW